MSSNELQTSRTSISNSQDRKLRYRNLLENLSILENDSSTNEDCMGRTAEALKEAQHLLKEGGVEEKVRHPGESYLDSRVVRATSDLVVRYSEGISGNLNTYDKHELAAHIKDNPEYWNFIFPKEVPPVSYLFGTFAPTPPEERVRVPRRRVERQQVAALKEPENVNRLEKTEEGSEMVGRVNKFIIKKYKTSREPLSYFHLVLDPESFSRTVENIYYVSFLAREGVVDVRVDEDNGLPFVTPMEETVNDNSRNTKSENQFIVSIDMNRWKQLLESFRISQAMLRIPRL